MRNLTIKRQKRFIGCAEKTQIYIEDPSSDEIIINNVSCRKIGELKNGEEKTFLISENAAKIYTISYKSTKDIYNDFVQLPAGENDIFLSGKSFFLHGFRFEGITEETTLKNRMNSLWEVFSLRNFIYIVTKTTSVLKADRGCFLILI